ncbi:MAG TPA: hypothetical protein VFR37_10745 [Longimicrobium sp.]|nr:hypothetical protein [Longimicrobium sp.]
MLPAPILNARGDASRPPSKVDAMPEMSETHILLLGRYQNLGTPEEITRKQADLEKDNQKQRQEIDGLKQKVAPEGAVVLTDDADKKRWEKFKGLPEDFDPEAVVRERDDLKVKDETRTRTDAARAAAKAAWGNEAAATLLLRLDGFKDGTYEVRKEKKDDGKGGKVDTEVAYFTPAGENQTAVRLVDHAEATLEKEVVQLLASTAGTTANGGPAGGTAAGGAGRGAPMIQQRSGAGTAATTVAEADVRERKAGAVRAGL